MHPRTRALVGAGSLVFAAVASGQATDPTVFTLSTGGDNLVSWNVAPDGTLSQRFVIPTGDAPQSISLSPDGAILAAQKAALLEAARRGLIADETAPARVNVIDRELVLATSPEKEGGH